MKLIQKELRERQEAGLELKGLLPHRGDAAQNHFSLDFKANLGQRWLNMGFPSVLEAFVVKNHSEWAAFPRRL